MSPENAVAQVLKRYQEAVYAKDLEAFMALYDERIHVFDMWAQWTHEGGKAWREMAQGWFNFLGNERVMVEMEDLRTTITPELATATAFVKYNALSAEGKELRSLWNRKTYVLAPRDGQWKIVHEHSSAPIEHQSLKAILQR